MLTLRQLRYLVALGRKGHFGRAATACGVSQPALSMQIRELESSLGTVLVERRRAHAALTAGGREAVRRARAILLEVDDLAAAVRGGGTMAGVLKLGVIPTIAPYLLPRVLPLIAERFPALRLELREARTEEIVRELADGELDIALLSLPADRAGLVAEPLFDDRFLLVRPATPGDEPGRPLLRDDIATDRLLLLEEGHCLRDQALSFCATGGDANLRSLGATSLATVVQMVAAGYGETLVPEMAVGVEVRDERLAVMRFAEPQPHRTIGLVWRRANPRTDEFRRLASQMARLAPSR